MSETLKPCPFCGRAPVVTEDDSYGCCAISCDCDLEPFVQRFADEMAEAVEVWNRRTPPPDSERWQPIETAPDGREVLLYPGVFLNHVVGVHTEFGWSIGTRGWVMRRLPDLYAQPTHWMPLPAPPSEEGPQ